VLWQNLSFFAGIILSPPGLTCGGPQENSAIFLLENALKEDVMKNLGILGLLLGGCMFAIGCGDAATDATDATDAAGSALDTASHDAHAATDDAAGAVGDAVDKGADAVKDAADATKDAVDKGADAVKDAVKGDE
jgi:hypothetical protein